MFFFVKNLNCRHNSLRVSLVFLGLASLSQAQPGNRDHLAALHPGYTLINVMPNGIQPGVSGMDFMVDGRLVISTWGGDHTKLTPPSKNGQVYILGNVLQDDTSKYTSKLYATGLQEPLGLKIVNDTIYVSERQSLAMLVDANKNGTLEPIEYKQLAAYTAGGLRHEFFFGLLYKDGFFYGAHSLALVDGGSAAVPQPDANRGTYVKINRTTGVTEYIAGGARQPFGFGMNPEGDMFSTEVQGTWNPACAFTHVRAGRFYGHPQLKQVPANPFDSMPYNPPAVLMPESEIANAPGQPLYVPTGIFKGQFFVGDVTYGGINRIYLEKVNGEYQGGVTRFSAGLQCGPSRLAFGSNGDLFVGEIGDESGNWNEPNKKLYGLQKLKPNGKTTFEMLNAHSRPKGMELEFTEEVALDADQAAKYEVLSWTYTRTADYGGSPVNKKPLAITSVKVDPTRKKVYLEIAGLQTGYLVYIRLVGLKSAAGTSPWSTETWYTLNALGSGLPFESTLSMVTPNKGWATSAFKASRFSGGIAFKISLFQPYILRILDAKGAQKAIYHGIGPGEHSFATQGLNPGIFMASLESQGKMATLPLAVY